MQPPHNVSAIQLGTGEFAFCLGATSRSDTKLKGFRDFDNVVAYKLDVTNERLEHEGSYRGLRVIDEVYNIKQGLEYLVRCDGFTRENLALLFMGSDGTPHTQEALTEDPADVLAFTSQDPSVTDRWYDLYVDDAHVRSLTSAIVFAGTPLAATTADTGDTFTDAAHGLSNGDRVILVTLVTTTGVSVLTPYFVVGRTTDTFQLSATSGGSALALTTDGSCTYLAALTEDDGTGTGDFQFDATLGRIRLLTAQTTNAYAYLTGSAITSSDSTWMDGIKPLENASFTGYGRLVTFQNKTRLPLYDHQDFSCTISVDTVTESDGKTPVTFELHVKVTSDHGNLLVAKSAI